MQNPPPLPPYLRKENTLVWMIIEAAASIGTGVIAGSALLIAFGADSVIELVSGATLLWRLAIETRDGDREQAARAEHRAAWIVAVMGFRAGE